MESDTVAAPAAASPDAADSGRRPLEATGALGAANPVAEQPEPHVDWRSLALCLLGTFLLRAAANGAGTLVSLHLAWLSFSPKGPHVGAGLVGLAGLLFYSTELLGSPFFGTLSDLKGRKPFMVLGSGFGATAVLLLFIAPAIPLVLLAKALQGLSTASSAPSTLSLLSAETGASEKLRGRVMSLFEVATLLGIGLGFATGGALWDALRHDAFLAVLGIYAASALFLWLVRDRHVVAKREAGLSHRWAFVRSGSAMRLIPAWIAVNAVVGLWFSHLDFQMGKGDDPTQLLVGGFTGRQIGLYTAGVILLFGVGIFVWSLTFGRLSATRIMAISLAGLFAGVVLLFLLNHSQPGDALRIRSLLGLMSVALLVLSGFTPAALVYLAHASEEFPESRGSMMGLYSVFLGVGQGIGAGVGGVFAAWRAVDGMIVLTMILSVLAAVCVGLLIQHDARGAPRQRAGALPPIRLH